MTILLPFFVILFVSVFFSTLFNRLHLPWVVALIISGIVIGPYGLHWYSPVSSIEFMGSIGLMFLMFIAGLEIKLSHIQEIGKEVFTIAIINSVIPFIAGFLVGYIHEYETVVNVLIGLIFSSSSIAVILPALEASDVLEHELGQVITVSTILQDVLSLVLLSMVLQTIQPETHIPLPIFYVLLLSSLVMLRLIVPKLRDAFVSLSEIHEDFFEQEIRLVFLILVGIVLFFQFLGLHAVTGGFFAGLVLSETIRSKMTMQKLHTISYGLFIPIFFVTIGAKTDVQALFNTGAVLLAFSIVIGSVSSKFSSGWISAKISGFSAIDSIFIAGSTIPQLSTTLAVAYTGYELEILDNNLLTSIIFLTISTTFIGPIIINALSPRIQNEMKGIR